MMAKQIPLEIFWSGTMDDNETELSGHLYRLDGQGNYKVKDSGYCVTNGPAFSRDGSKLYHTNTFKREIYSFDLSPDGNLSNKQLLFKSLRKTVIPTE